MTIQEHMKTKLESLDIPSKRIDCYGGQIVITCHSRSAADKWVPVLSKFSKVRGVTDTLDYAAKQQGTNLNPSTVPVVKVFATIR